MWAYMFENTPRGGVNKCMANLMTNNVELETKCNTLSVAKECSRIPREGLWTNSSWFLNKSWGAIWSSLGLTQVWHTNKSKHIWYEQYDAMHNIRES